ncbi:outer membrane protein assembly factor BamD [Oceanisphaera arctica]|uniref:Outer membrane protein assembly factor BamD n=1 Tax=Oceanisphaera arctica TaxID=641510 RepID=A0A2P5THR5_9GAMM|nr:outer membrane protein assembly factor BamD [Oceanisphaera arctica]PPL14063.1 outer membrane protein assembly factor BamD [Oceanisphaera arctica]GHA08719.1 outer membrane protein assembly factor BamD [Oceanisphaera arctica]
MAKQRSVWLSLTLALALAATGCSSTKKDQVADEPPEVLYQDAQERLQAGNFIRAAELLEAMDSRYPFGAYSNQVQLDLIYAYYKQDDSARALANVDRFIRLNPNHPSVDYAQYMRGLTNMATDHNFFQELLNVDRADRDPAYARQAFADFRQLLRQYPDSVYAADARARMTALKNRLARYDLSVAQFYMKRGAWLAAANRAKFVVQSYPDTDTLQPALQIMTQAYDKLGLSEMANHAEAVLKANFPAG